MGTFVASTRAPRRKTCRTDGPTHARERRAACGALWLDVKRVCVARRWRYFTTNSVGSHVNSTFTNAVGLLWRMEQVSGHSEIC